MRTDLAIAAAAVLLAAVTALPTAADAKIRCDQEYQLNKSGPVRTPYCEDEYLARVATSRGRPVSGAAIRASYGIKRDVCRSLRFDTRVASICGPLQPDRNRRFRLWLID